MLVLSDSQLGKIKNEVKIIQKSTIENLILYSETKIKYITGINKTLDATEEELKYINIKK